MSETLLQNVARLSTLLVLKVFSVRALGDTVYVDIRVQCQRSLFVLQDLLTQTNFDANNVSSD